MRGCWGEGSGDYDSLTLATGEGVEGAIRKLLGLRLAHGVAGDALVALRLQSGSVPGAGTCP